MKTPLVTIGIPVRNGSEGLRVALDSILNQTYKNLEIIISENKSTDDTYQICLEYQQNYKDLIKVFRQENSLSVVENFRFVLDNANGELFMWVAHDDTRELNYIETLLQPYRDVNNDIILSFGDLYIINDEKVEHKEFYFENTRLSIFSKFLKTSNLQGYHMYGLWKTKELQKIPFLKTSYYPDMPILMAASYLGDFKHVSGASFFYREVVKTKEERLKYQDNLSKMPKFVFFKFLLVNYKAVKVVSNNFYASLSTLLLCWKYFRIIPKYVKNKLHI